MNLSLPCAVAFLLAAGLGRAGPPSYYGRVFSDFIRHSPYVVVRVLVRGQRQEVVLPNAEWHRVLAQQLHLTERGYVALMARCPVRANVVLLYTPVTLADRGVLSGQCAPLQRPSVSAESNFLRRSTRSVAGVRLLKSLPDERQQLCLVKEAIQRNYWIKQDDESGEFVLTKANS